MADQNVLADMIFSVPDLADSSGSQAPRTVTVGASPFTYRATSRQAIHIVGGTISAASYARGAVVLTVGLLAGGEIFEMNAGDVMTITYLTVPTITVIPR
jgi:hypothetical protein